MFIILENNALPPGINSQIPTIFIPFPGSSNDHQFQNAQFLKNKKAALIINENVKSTNFNIDTIKQKIYVFGIAHDENEKKEITIKTFVSIFLPK